MTGKETRVDGTRIHYVERGSGLPVVLVHGNTGSCRWFDKVLDLPGCRTFALDMPNFGRSGPLSGEPDIDLYADVVGGFLRAVKIVRPVLVGHSMGGAVAMSLAARSPGLLRGLVLVDSAAPSGLQTPVDRHPFIESMRTNRDVLSAALAAVVPTLKDKDFFNTLVDDAVIMAAPAWVGNARALGRFDCRGRCASFTAPVLVVWGRKDVIVTEEMARETAAAFPNARLVILDDVGHSVVVEDPGAFVRLLLEFVAALGKDG
jgi:pimeloyl-ACP methyl ester carboxylesterase